MNQGTVLQCSRVWFLGILCKDFLVFCSKMPVRCQTTQPWLDLFDYMLLWCRSMDLGNLYSRSTWVDCMRLSQIQDPKNAWKKSSVVRKRAGMFLWEMKSKIFLAIWCPILSRCFSTWNLTSINQIFQQDVRSNVEFLLPHVLYQALSPVRRPADHFDNPKHSVSKCFKLVLSEKITQDAPRIDVC